MKIIKVATLFYTDNSVEHFKRTLRFNPEDYGMTFVYEEENPDFVIVTNYIYESKKIFQKFLNYYNKNVVLIYFAGECTSPDLNIFDYAIVFDRFLQNNDRVARLSTCSFYSVSLFDEYIDSEITQEILESKVNFCNFMYSHSYIYRDQLFAKISQYKKVDSIGKHLNNTGTLNTRHSKDWRKLSIEERLSYKFSIAAENAQFSGYTSEKILSCFQAHTIPIYWG